MVTGHEGVGLEAERCHDQLVGRYADSFAVANEARPKGRALAAEAIALWPGCCRSVMARTATREPGSGGQPLWMFLPERALGSRGGVLSGLPCRSGPVNRDDEGMQVRFFGMTPVNFSAFVMISGGWLFMTNNFYG